MSQTTTYPPNVHRVRAGLIRAEITGVTPHTLAVALARLESAAPPPDFAALSEIELAVAFLQRAGYPVSMAEMNLFLGVAPSLTLNSLSADDIGPEAAVHYMRWVSAFLNDPDATRQQNARTLLRWLVTQRSEALRANQSALDVLRTVGDDPQTGAKTSAYVVFGLGSCGTLEDYDRVIRHAERVIEEDRERLELVAEGLYRLYPPALINALQFFLEQVRPDSRSKQFVTGMHLLAKVAEIEDRAFWKTYAEDMERIVERLSDVAERNPSVERVLDQIEKNLAYATYDDEG